MANKRWYGSPRWSGELLDCSMPMTFDTYSECSYRCLYCFAFFQKSVGAGKSYYMQNDVVPVNAKAVIDMFDRQSGQFGPYIAARKVMQWGGMSDPFDENERRQGVSLELLEYFRRIHYPISFSTKGVWWAEDERYVRQFIGADHFNLKVSIITQNDEMARRVEVLVPSPTERLRLIEKAAKWGIGGVTLRLRPYVLGLTDKTAMDLIQAAASAGASAVSTEFMCLEGRSRKARGRYAGMSKEVGFDILDFYKKNTPGGSGYMRLNRKLKEPYMLAMRAECDRLGLRFYVSDAHFKELCANGSCCGLPESWNYSRGQYTEALLLAKKNGQVTWSEIAAQIITMDTIGFGQAIGYNQTSSERRSQFHDISIQGWMRWCWNNVNGAHSPYKYFGGVLVPDGRDEEGDVVYAYRGLP